MLIAGEMEEDAMDVGLLIARLVFGLLLAAHGCQKLFGWFGGPGLSGTARFFESLGFHPGRAFVLATVFAECGGGLLLALGLVQPAAAATIISVMIVAIATVHWGKGLLALTGPGAYSLDAALGLTLWWTAEVTAVVLATGVVAGVMSLGIRRVGPAVAHA